MPNCECGCKLIYDKFAKMYICKECDPHSYYEYQEDLGEEKARRVREE